VNGEVHYLLTRRWAEAAGFTAEEAETVARWDVRTDSGFRGGASWANKRYHLVPFGAWRTAHTYLAWAVAERSIPHLGVALHAAQDAIGHGWIGSILHWPGIDIVSKRSPRVVFRMEVLTKEWVNAYLDYRIPAEAADLLPPVPPPLPPDLMPITRAN
jgi:hypothetical protein